MFIETKEGQTHATCEEQLKKYGGKAKCCLCNKHDGCTLKNISIDNAKDWTKPVSSTGGDLTLAKLSKEYKKIKRAELQDATESLAEQMVKTIANKHIKVQDTHEGRIAQRYWYKEAQKMLKKLVKEYERVCKEGYL